MPTAERLIVLLNSALAAVAFVVNAYAAKDAGPPWKAIRSAVATLAVVYSLGYLWLFIYPDKILGWSSVFRGISPLSRPIVWIIPAIVMRRTQKRVHQAIKSEEHL